MKNLFISLLLAIILLNCSKSDPEPVIDWQPSSIDGQFVFNTFKSVGLARDGKIQKWSQNQIFYWFDPSSVKDSYTEAAVDSIFMQINELSKSCQFTKSSDESKALIKVFNGFSADFEKKYKQEVSGAELRAGGIAFLTLQRDAFDKVNIWLSNVLTSIEKRNVARHEIGHAIGFSHVPTQRSIMWDTVTDKYDTRQYTDVDKAYIQILYDTQAKAGMTQAQLIPVFQKYLK
jgi:hypothetical protein